MDLNLNLREAIYALKGELNFVINRLIFKRAFDLLKFSMSGSLYREMLELRKKIIRTVYSFKIESGHEYYGGPKVSIVIPTRNECKYLPRLLSSLKMSIYKNFEVVCIDYLSTDGTPEIARKYRVRIISVDRKGVGYADHLGVLNAQGEIIIKTDADTIFPPNLIYNTVKVLTSGRYILYHVGHLYYDAGILENLMAHLYDKYWRDIWKTTGHFIAFWKDIYSKVKFDVDADLGQDDFKFGHDVITTFGPKAICYDPNNIILVSARKLRRAGLLRYTLGIR